MAQVVLDRLVKNYDGVIAVNNVSMTIEDGEFVSLVGPSGCGKTTTLGLVAGLIDITDGTIRIDDTVINALDPKDRDIAMVFQNYALYPNKTVYDNLAFPLKMRKMPKPDIDQRVRQTAETLSITNLLARRPRELSGGQQQRVALGRALVRNPKVFLMDEPLSNLDAKLRVQMRTELKRFHQELGATVIYVTHDQLEAMTMSDKVAVMEGGNLQQFGAPDEIYTRPANAFVATFMGSPSMNLLRGRTELRDGRLTVGADDWQVTIPADLSSRIRALDDASELIVGCRPSHVELSTDANGEGFPAQVYTIEPTGEATFVHLRVGGITLIATVSAESPIRVNDRVRVRFPGEYLHVFDAKTERSIHRTDEYVAVDRRRAA